MNPSDADTPDNEAPAPAPASSDDAAAAPKKRRAPRKKAVPAPEAVEGGADSTALASVVPAAAELPAAPKPAEAAVTPAPANAADAPSEGADAASDATAAAPEGGDAAAGEPRERSRRSRRRRGRRGADKRERADAAPAGAEGEPGRVPAAADDADDSDDEGEGDEAAPREEVPTLPRPEASEVFAEVLSGAYDAAAEVAEAPELPAKRVLAPDVDAPKLHKVLAQAGIGSRRDMEQMILEGRITVNGQPAHIGQRISQADRIAVGGKPVRVRIAPPPPRVLAYHKPAGEVVTHDDPQHRPTVFRRLPRLPQGKWQSVGRLDINTEGLLLFTNSGDLANRLMHPRFGVEREYAVRSLGVLSDEERQRLLDGVDIDGRPAAFLSIADGGGEGANHWYRVVISEGRYREVRKLFEAVGHAVSRLIRIRYGAIVLPRGLKRGMWCDLSGNDVAQLRRLTQPEGGAADDSAPPRGAGPARDERGERGDSKRNRRGGRRGKGKGPGQGPRGEGMPYEGREPGEPSAIPNPLQQTYDKRAIQQARAPKREYSDDGPIPNPLQQTYDKRALQQARAPKREYGEDGPIPNPLQQTYDKRFASGPKAGGGGGGGGKRRGAGLGGGGGGGGGQPDPMRTSVGYIGADSFKRKGGGGGGGAGGGGRGGRGRNKR